MKRVLTILIALIAISVSVNAQENTTTTERNDTLVLSQKDSLLFRYLEAYHTQLREPRFRLFPTQNTWTFLKLDTMTGQIWQVQYSVDKSPRMEYVLDDDIRIYSWDRQICGSFTLYETKNMYNFILLDTIDGRCWQVQWSIEVKNRGVLRIY